MAIKSNCRKLWIKHNGPIPKDWEGRTYEIHHVDGNRKNDVIENFRCVSIREHYDIHWFQGDWGACALLATKLKMSVVEISSLRSIAAREKVENGTHHWLGGENSKKRVKNGTHNFLTLSKERSINGTHNFQGPKTNEKRIQDGKHNFLDSESQSRNAKKRIENGTHHFLQIHKCPYCGKIGKGPTMFRNHFDRCKVVIECR